MWLMKNAKNSWFEWFIEPTAPLSIWLKFAIIAMVSVAISAQPTHPTWAISMILVAALLLVPIGFQQLMLRSSYFSSRFTSVKPIYFTHLISAILLSISFTMKQGLVAGLLALPYSLWCGFITLKILKIDVKISYLTTLSAWGFLTNAAVWCVFDRLDFQPWHFSPWIVLLTGAHFHYAGFALTLSLALFLNETPNDIVFKNCSRAVLLGVVFTALGITTTQLGFTHLIETASSIWMAIAAFSVGFAVLLRGVREMKYVKTLWISSGLCLMMGMTLALGYALRNFILIEWLSMANMQAVHGTLNALGFGTLMILGWAFKSR
jgi:YndJ-like protein